MLGLKVAAPVHGIFEFRAGLFEQLHGLGIRYAGKVVFNNVCKPVKQSLVNKAVEELQLVRAALHNGSYYVFYHCLGNFHVSGQVAEGHFRLYHPELRRMARREGIFRPERGAEGIYIAESHCKRFAVKLSAHGQISFPAEEILAVVNLAVLGLGQVIHVKRCHAEHFARAFAVARGDERGMHIKEAALVKEAVYGLRHNAAHPECRLEHVRAGPKVLNGAKVFKAVPFFLKGIVPVALA